MLGTGGVSRKFLLGMRVLGPRARVTVVASRRRDNAARFAAELGVPHVADDFAAAAAAPEADFVYVATPPSEHEAHALLAIAAGKPVLVEKPFAADAAAAARIAGAARTAGVFCMEAMWTRFLPLMAAVRDAVAAGRLGELRGFDGCFLGAGLPDAGVSLFDPDRGGGALMHRGVYPLSLARHLLGPIAEVRAMGRVGATGVDEDCALMLRHASGAISTLRAGLRSAGDTQATLWGTAGTLRFEGAIWRPIAARLTPVRPGPAGGGGRPPRFEAFREGGLVKGLQQRSGGLLRLGRGGRGQRLFHPYGGNGYGHEAEAAMAAVAGGRTESPVMPLDESIEIMAAIDAAKAQWTGTG